MNYEVYSKMQEKKRQRETEGGLENGQRGKKAKTPPLYGLLKL